MNWALTINVTGPLYISREPACDINELFGPVYGILIGLPLDSKTEI